MKVVEMADKVGALLLLDAILEEFLFFFFNDTATTEIYTLSLHDALPISLPTLTPEVCHRLRAHPWPGNVRELKNALEDRKSTRLNSSHGYISYAVFCLKKKSVLEKVPHTQHHLPDDRYPTVCFPLASR